MLCEKMIQDFLNSCEPCKHKNPEKTHGWKQFQESLLRNKFTYSLAISSTQFNDFVKVKNLISKCNLDKELLRVKNNCSKQETKDVFQDLQTYKTLKLKSVDDQSPEFVKKIEEELGETWSKHV